MRDRLEKLLVATLSEWELFCFSADDWCEIGIFKCNNSDDVNTLNEFLSKCNYGDSKDRVTTDVIGKEIFIELGMACDLEKDISEWCGGRVYGTFEDIISTMQDNVNYAKTRTPYKRLIDDMKRIL